MKKLLFLPVLLLVFACGSNSSQREAANGEVTIDSLKSEVLAIHDEVMPKMGALRKTSQQLQAMADSIVTMDSLQSTELAGVAQEIKNANEGMMNWMRNYEPDFEGTDEEIRAYLKEQKKAIQQVKDAMERSLAKGEEKLQEQE
ncbi:MAG: hypothetical protein Tsb0034_25000 [Ekhidna sp.]